MFFLYPVGNEQAVYSQPYLTWIFIVICVVIQAWSTQVGDDRMLEVVRADQALSDVLTEDRGQTVSSEWVDSLRPSQQALVIGRVAEAESDDESVSMALEDAAASLLDAVDRLPAMKMGYVPADGGLGSAFTSIVTHGGWFHLITNLFVFLLCGSVLECFWRTWAYVGMAVIAGLCGVLAYHLSDSQSPVPLIGASGLVAGVMAAYLVGFARSTLRLGYLVWVFVFIKTGSFRVPAWTVILAWAGLQVWALIANPSDGVAYSAHVGGFMVGLLLALLADRLKLIARDGGYELVPARKPVGRMGAD